MSAENVEIVHRVYEVANRRDVAGVLALYDPGIEIDASGVEVVGVSERRYRGHDGLRSFFREWHEAWGDVEYVYEEIIDAGEHQVVSVDTTRTRGRASSVEVTWAAALLWTIRDGSITRVEWYKTLDQALEASDSGRA